MIKWKVQERPPAGLSRVSEFRRWPSAEYDSGAHCAWIDCDTTYSLAAARSGQHGPLTVWIADYGVTPFRNSKVLRRYSSLDEAKSAVWRILGRNLKMLPKEFLQ